MRKRLRKEMEKKQEETIPEQDDEWYSEFPGESSKSAKLAKLTNTTEITETKVQTEQTEELLAAVCTWDVAKLKLLLAYNTRNLSGSLINLSVVDDGVLKLLLVQAITENFVLNKSYEIIKLLIDHGARLDGNDNINNADAAADAASCFTTFVKDRIVELKCSWADDICNTSIPSSLDENKVKAELDLVDVLKLSISRAGTASAFAKILEDEEIIKDCCAISSLGNYHCNSTFPLLKLFLVQGLDIRHCENLLNTSLMIRSWILVAFLIECGVSCPNWNLQEYLCSFQLRYPQCVGILKEAIVNRLKRRNLIHQHLFQSVSPACASSAPSFDVSPLCTIMAEYYFQL